MHRLEMVHEPVGRAEVMKTTKAEWEGDKSGVEQLQHVQLLPSTTGCDVAVWI